MESAPLGLAFSKEGKNPRSWGWGIFFLPSFPRPAHGLAQGREASAFGLLQALRGFGIAAGFRDAL